MAITTKSYIYALGSISQTQKVYCTNIRAFLFLFSDLHIWPVEAHIGHVANGLRLIHFDGDDIT